MSDPILLFLMMDAVALLVLGVCAAVSPLAATTFLSTMLSGLGMLLCLPTLLPRVSVAGLDIPIGPPGLSLHFALDPVSAFFLLVVFQGGTALLAFQAATIPAAHVATKPAAHAAPVQFTACCLAGAVFSVLSADAMTLGTGLSIVFGAIWLAGRRGRADQGAAQGRASLVGPVLLVTPLLVLASICLLTPAGFAPRFDAIRAAPVDQSHAIVAAALPFVAAAVVTFAGLTRVGPDQYGWTGDALTAGVLIPTGAYLLLRVVIDLAGGALPSWCGLCLLAGGGAIAIIQAWRAATHPDIGAAVACLVRRQMGLVMAGTGLALIARSTDLPGAEAFALAAILLSVMGSSLAGVLAALAAHAIGASAGTSRLSRLGGLVQSMPRSSAALGVGLLALSGVPPGLGFASLWLLFQAILSAPRTGGLMAQLPLALMAAALALSTSLGTAASVRLAGIALLGRPRTPQGAGAAEGKSSSATILLGLAALSGLAGVLPGVALWPLTGPAIQALIGEAAGIGSGLAFVVPSVAAAGYLALPVLALMALATGAALLLPRWSHGGLMPRFPRRESKAAGPWVEGMPPPVGLPFGEPEAQSVGEGFLPAMPDVAMPAMPRLVVFSRTKPPSATAGPWIILIAFGVLLTALAVIG